MSSKKCSKQNFVKTTFYLTGSFTAGLLLAQHLGSDRNFEVAYISEILC